jgi:hypothetical protein
VKKFTNRMEAVAMVSEVLMGAINGKMGRFEVEEH